MYPNYLNVIQLDNGRFHKSYRLKIPNNIVLIFQHPYAPELNPIERFWQELKTKLSWDIFQNLEALKEKVALILKEFSPEQLLSLTGWNYILDALNIIA